MRISLIAAMAQNRVIGRNDANGRPELPWHLPDDFAFFKQKTSGHAIIMGRKSLDALGKPLPNRTNIVITHNPAFDMAGVTVTNSLDDALAAGQRVEVAHDQPELFIIGGAEVYALSLPLADRIYLTEIQGTYEGNARFPQFDEADWQEVSRRPHPADTRHETAFDFVVYDRVH